MLGEHGDDDSFMRQMLRSARDFLFYSPLGRCIIEGVQIFFMLAIGYMLMCSFGEILVFAIKTIKYLLRGY